MRLRSLEEELDLPLVNRGQRFEGFTAPGERVLAWARTVLAAYDGLQAEAAACRGNLVGTLRLGVVPLSSFDPLALMQQLHKEHPNLRFELSALSSEQILEQLASNRLDLGVSYLDRLDNERFDSLALGETRMGLLYDQRFFQFRRQAVELGGVDRTAAGHAHQRHALSPVHRPQLPQPRPAPATVVANRCRPSVVTSSARRLCCAVMPLDGGLKRSPTICACNPSKMPTPWPAWG
jgi:DNA-binding transcriptional LysR family regulator